jgi:alanine-synthesizing transaminase
MFSSRVPRDLAPNRLTQAVQRVRAAGRTVLDLTLTNPTAAGIEYPASMPGALADAASARYDPTPLGLPGARAAVSRDYARRGVDMAPDRIVLTASTSEAYSVLFKLLCEPSGDAALVPFPSYPLFDHLTRLDGVTPLAYRLEYHGRWAVDFDTVDAVWTDRVRAVLAVSPNNPTGSILTGAELAGLARRCAERDAALIVDEVFADYPLTSAPVTPAPVVSGFSRTRVTPAPVMPAPVVSGFSRTRDPVPPCLTFRLGGLSKSAGLPQVKLGWIAVGGPDALVRGALDRLELICDTYLSVATPVQVAAPRLVEDGALVRQRILERVRTNDESLRALSAAYPSVEVLHGDAGWSAVLRVASTSSEEDLVLALVERDGVLVHPGFFFDFAHESFLVVSLLPEPAIFFDGIRRVMERVHV